MGIKGVFETSLLLLPRKLQIMVISSRISGAFNIAQILLSTHLLKNRKEQTNGLNGNFKSPVWRRSIDI